MKPQAAHAVLGAAVADAASLGLHWLYDPERVAAVARAHGGPAFVPVDAAHYEGVPGYFAHAGRRSGMPTQYGEVLRVMLRSLQASGGSLDVSDYQRRFAAHFGPGGDYRGYIDRPTAGTLANIAAERLAPSGIDDDQLPALATLPALVACGQGDVFEQAVRASNDNDAAVAYGGVFVSLLRKVLAGQPLAQALRDVAGEAPAELAEPLTAALDSAEPDPVAYAEHTGRACHLPMGVPLSFHILARARSFREGVERNILAGGDSAGRAIVVGSVLAAVHGVDGEGGVPLAWLLALDDGAALWRACEEIAALA